VYDRQTLDPEQPRGLPRPDPDPPAHEPLNAPVTSLRDHDLLRQQP
jgi:hypothetical protein